MALYSNTIQTKALASCLAFIILITQCLAMDIAYCSFVNTGSGFSFVYNQFQTNGACFDICKSSYAYAVISGANCWCSNYTPVTSTSTSDCDVACPGYGTEWCGNPAIGLYAYIAISGHSPYGIAGSASSSSSSSSSQPATSSVSTTPTSSRRSSSTSFGAQTSLTVIATTQSTRSSSRIVEPPSTATEPSTTPATSSHPVVVQTPTSTPSTSTSPTTTAAPPASTTIPPTQILTSVITVTGQVKTILVTPTSPSDSTLGSSSAGSNGGGGGVSAGKVAGIVVGVAVGLGILIGLGVFFWLKRRHRGAADAASTDGASNHGASNNGVPSRQVSQMSSAGLLGKPPRILTAGIATANGPKSPESSQLDRRSVGTDQRLNPYAIYAHEESRLSNVSLQDNQDYSRQLRVGFS